MQSKFADDTKLGEAVDSLEGREALQRDLDKLGVWATSALFCTWDRGNPGCLYRPGNERLESSDMNRNLGVLVNGQLNMSQQCPGSQEGQSGGIRQSITRQSKEGIVPLYSVLVWPHLEYGVHFCVAQYKKDIKLLETIQRRAMKMVNSLDEKLHAEWLRLLGLFSVEKNCDI
ncbi:hypothetical protein WISP_36449 [Willisornis vidua]|uniref:Uncharacterized protein n=1 Tax=Willisornis vidua TaxID=1566151 RepID=A0ABQ9DIE7_9PASS|nr:hypothetical protein WISP_36449 [Willisornis vidua]